VISGPEQCSHSEAAQFKQLVEEICSALRIPVITSDGRSGMVTVTLSHILRCGAFFTGLLLTIGSRSNADLSARDQELLTLLASNIRNPDVLSELLLSRFTEGLESPKDLQRVPARLRRFLNSGFSPRRKLIELVKEFVPEGRRGAKRKILDGDPARMLKRSEQLQPALASLMLAVQASKKRPLSDCIEYVAPEHPEACDYLRSQLVPLQGVLDNKRFLDQVKTSEARVRLIADAMAGAELGTKPSYSVLRVREARRNARKSVKASTQKKI
jgi:hypothetical protein